MQVNSLMIRTKILATMGPAVGDPENLYRLFEAGADACRLNFSHGTLDSHLLMLRYIHEAAARFDHPIAILGDLGGPKIRLGPIAEVDATGGMPIVPGDTLTIQRAPIIGQNLRVSTTVPALVDDIRPGDRVYIEDGLLRFLCVDKKNDEIHLTCHVGGILKSAKGINLPSTKVSLPSITDRDWQCAEWAVDNNLDYLALSFVRSAADIELLRQYLKNRSSDINIIAKIEKAEAIQDIDNIIAAADGLMVARGDLGVEMDVAQVPIIQKDLIKRCQAAGKPVIVATQMLQSMIEQSTPTRAEVSDVANAIFDGTDAIMLSGETSVGKFPIGAVLTMSHIADITETYLNDHAPPETPLKLQTMQLSNAIARGVKQMVADVNLKLIILWSQTGGPARIFSKNRFPVPIIALSTDHRALRHMALLYGVIPLECSPPTTMDGMVTEIDALIRDKQLASSGDRVVIVTGSSLGTPGMMNGVVLHTVGTQPLESQFHSTFGEFTAM
jgi:pyruvate kinase